jgi:hypothetical protein
VTAEDLRERMAEAIAEKFTPSSAVLGKDLKYRDATLAERADKGGLAVFFTAGDGHRSFRSPTAREVAAAAMSVRWEDNARTKAEVERLRGELAEAHKLLPVSRHPSDDYRNALANAVTALAEQRQRAERYRLAWQNARERANASSESVKRLCEQRNLWIETAKGRQARAEQAEAERDVLEAVVERFRERHQPHDCRRDHAFARTPVPCVNADLCRCGSPLPCRELAALAAPESHENAEEGDQWRRDEREIDGGFSGCEFPRLWPPRRASETPGDAEKGSDDD